MDKCVMDESQLRGRGKKKVDGYEWRIEVAQTEKVKLELGKTIWERESSRVYKNWKTINETKKVQKRSKKARMRDELFV